MKKKILANLIAAAMTMIILPMNAYAFSDPIRNHTITSVRTGDTAFITVDGAVAGDYYWWLADDGTKAQSNAALKANCTTVGAYGGKGDYGTGFTITTAYPGNYFYVFFTMASSESDSNSYGMMTLEIPAGDGTHTWVNGVLGGVSGNGSDNDETTDIIKPSEGDVGKDGDDGVAGQSNGFAIAEGNNGSTWKVSGDDDGVDETNDYNSGYKPDVNVWARIADSAAKIYKIDIAWGSMKFEYNDGSGSWDVDTHSYMGNGGTPHWINSSPDGGTGGQVGDIDEVTSYEVGTNGTNNRVTVTNHSNSAVNALFEYATLHSSYNDSGTPSGAAVTPWNDGSTTATYTYGDYGAGFATGYDTHQANDVIGYFYGNNTEAAKGHLATGGTYDGATSWTTDYSGATAVSAWTTDGNSTDLSTEPTFLSITAKLADTDVNAQAHANMIVLPTADYTGTGSNSAANIVVTELGDASTLAPDDWQSANYDSGARSANVYFAFSGQPDKGQGAFLSNFTKVGVITVTVTPNNTTEYNKP